MSQRGETRSQPEGGGLQGHSYVYNLCILHSNLLGVGGVLSISSTDDCGLDPTASRLISSLAPCAPLTWAAVDEMGSATLLGAWIVPVRSQSQTVGATLTNAAIRGGVENLLPNILVF